MRPVRAADHSTPSSAAGHGRVELYLYPPSGLHRDCNGITLPFFINFILIINVVLFWFLCIFNFRVVFSLSFWVLYETY